MLGLLESLKLFKSPRKKKKEVRCDYFVLYIMINSDLLNDCPKFQKVLNVLTFHFVRFVSIEMNKCDL